MFSTFDDGVTATVQQNTYGKTKRNLKGPNADPRKQLSQDRNDTALYLLVV